MQACTSKKGDEDLIAINDGTCRSYPGGKGGAGVYQTLINLIPPHETYIETHLGGGAIMRFKRSAKINIGIDLDPDVTSQIKYPKSVCSFISQGS